MAKQVRDSTTADPMKNDLTLLFRRPCVRAQTDGPKGPYLAQAQYMFFSLRTFCAQMFGAPCTKLDDACTMKMVMLIQKILFHTVVYMSWSKSSCADSLSFFLCSSFFSFVEEDMLVFAYVYWRWSEKSVIL